MPLETHKGVWDVHRRLVWDDSPWGRLVPFCTGSGRPGRCHQASQMPLVALPWANMLPKLIGKMSVVKVRQAGPQTHKR